MNYGYPGANSQIENHNVSEESFWPSFTDIMMVIVMVFLLVTVAVILNNWALISQLTNSVEAQQAATSLADNRREENINLENKLSQVQQNLLALNKQFEKEKADLEQTQSELAIAAEALDLKEQSLSSIETKLSSLSEKYEIEKQRLSSTNEQLSASELELSNTDKELLDIKQQLSNKESIIKTLDEKLLSVERTNVNTAKALEDTKAALANVVKEREALRRSNENEAIKVETLNKEIKEIQVANSTELKQLKSFIEAQKSKAAVLEKDKEIMNRTLSSTESLRSDLELQLTDSISEIQKLNAIIAESTQNTKAIEASANKSDASLKALEASLAEAETELLAKDETIQALSQAQETGNTQLRSLQGEYDTLDSKYQKLLRPARSSQGKFVVSVTYSNVKGRKTIRYKASPTSSYQTVSENQLANNLSELKKKHKENLYVKVVIPENSGLSYNEAWKFTINLQREYDYYYNDE